MVKPLVAAAAGATASAAVCMMLSKWAWRRKRPTVVSEAVEQRRSMFLQDLNGDDAPDAVVDKMLCAANWAPTHGQTQPWRFHIFRRETGAVKELFELLKGASEAWLSNGAPPEAQQELKKFVTKLPKKIKEIQRASHVIAIVMKRKANPEKVMPEWEEIAAVACAVQNAHIVACSHGVAAYWSSGGTEGPLATKEARELLELEDGDRCLGLMYVGMANKETWEKSHSRASRGCIDDKVTWR